MKQRTWSNLIKALPLNLTAKEAASIFRKSETLTRRRLIANGYKIKKAERHGPIRNVKGECVPYTKRLVKFGSVFILANRAKWMTVKGPIQDGLCVRRKCGNSKCVNINHLFLKDS